jgi:protein-disulfide isomerase
MSRRPALIVAAVLAVAGVALSAVLIYEHAVAHAGGTSFCAINEYVNCDRVAMSPYSVLLGMPVAAWGALGYGLAFLLAIAGMVPGRRREVWPAGLLFLVAAAAACASVLLAGISTLVIGALCILCTASWLTSFALLAAAYRACRPEGPLAAVRGDLALLRERKVTTAVLALAGVALVALVVAAFPRYGSGAQRNLGVPLPAGSAVQAANESQSKGPLVIVEFSDYQCPACARAYFDMKTLLAGRQGIQVVRRQFPLDSACNSALKRRLHPGSCDLAKVGICAEAQGKLEPMEDALFANQQAGRPVEELARASGLDMQKLAACLASAETEARLQSDIETGIRIGLKATPTFVVGGRQYAGALPPEALPPRTADASR